MIRDRITQYLSTLVTQIRCSKGNILLGRVTGAGAAQEITVGSGLSLTGTTLSATGGVPGPATVQLPIYDLGGGSIPPLIGPTEGMLAYIRDEGQGNRIIYYDGTGWLTVATNGGYVFPP